MHDIVASQYRLHCEQHENRQRHRSNPHVADRQPRKDSKNGVGDQSCRKAIHIQLWCTGEDSNLRTSLGGTDLQSVGFNHSPTCAKTLGRCGIALRPADCVSRQPDRPNQSADSRSKNYSFTLAKQGNQGRAQDNCEDHCTPGIKLRMECVGKTCRAATADPPAGITGKISFPGAGEGIRTPDPLITNQMLYRLSYASNSGDRCAFAQTDPSDPFQMSGTII